MFISVDFGTSYATGYDVGFTQLRSDGTVSVARSTSNVANFGNGFYGLDVVLASDCVVVRWDLNTNYVIAHQDITATYGIRTSQLTDVGTLGALIVANLNEQISSRLATSSYTAPTSPDNAGIAAIKAKTDNLPASPAAAGEYTTAIAAIPTMPLLAANYTPPDNAGIAALPTLAEIEAAKIPVNIKEVNDVEITGVGTELNPWGPI